MNDIFMLLSDKIYDIKDQVSENDYLQIMNMLKDLYITCTQCSSSDPDYVSEDESRDESRDESHDESHDESDYYSDDDSYDDTYDDTYDEETNDIEEVNYEKDVVYSYMFEEYICKCNTNTYQCLCRSSLNLFRYCKNYQKIVDICPNILFVMKFHFSNIEYDNKIDFEHNISINNIMFSVDEFEQFSNIARLLLDFISFSNNYTKRCLILIACNYMMKNLYYIINTNNIRFALYDKINEILIQNNNIYDNQSFSDILDENDESIDLLHHWLSIIRPYILEQCVF